jgi:hypothetical protein
LPLHLYWKSRQMEVHALAGTLSVNLVSGPQGGSVYTHLCSGNSLLLHGTAFSRHALPWSFQKHQCNAGGVTTLKCGVTGAPTGRAVSELGRDRVGALDCQQLFDSTSESLCV